MRRVDWAGMVSGLIDPVAWRLRLVDVALAASLLTRLPVSLDPAMATQRSQASIWAYPVVGLIVGVLGGLVYAALLWLGAVAGVAAAAAIGAQALATGFLHEDGLADTADGLGGGRDREARLAIMRDSRIGAFGAGALILGLLARWSAVSVLSAGEAILILAAVGAASRGCVAVAMYALPPARKDGLAALVGRPEAQTALAAAAIGGSVLLLFGGAGLAALLAAVIAASILGRIALRRIGGQTGDILGAIQQCAEIAALAMLAS